MAQTGFVTGDSVSVKPVGTSWREQLSTSNTTNATAGWDLILNIDPRFSLDIGSTADYTIIQGGVNDINVPETSANIIAATRSILAKARARVANTTSGFTDIGVIGVTPWGSNGGWTAGKQTVTDEYNTWLRENQWSEGFTLIDVYDLLEDPTAPDELEPDYRNADAGGVHLNAAGAAVVATAADLVIAGFLNMNTQKAWKGAVEPSESSPSGNQLAMWKGAVEPAGAVGGGGDPAATIATKMYAVDSILGVDPYGIKTRSTIEHRPGMTVRGRFNNTLMYVIAGEAIASGDNVAVNSSFTASVSASASYTALYAIGSAEWGWVAIGDTTFDTT